MKDSNKIALITGITGQDGSYLCEPLLEKGYTVHGIVRRTSNMLRSRISDATKKFMIGDYFCTMSDLADSTTLRRIISDVRPTELYHLTGQSHVGLSFEIPEATCEEAGMATLRLLEMARSQPQPVKFIALPVRKFSGMHPRFHKPRTHRCGQRAHTASPRPLPRNWREFIWNRL
ncbi:MAG TPA: GDP-mannose 4,6-dehydratase [Candidatus Udaeobacter sp.]|jgi:GDPmannose 4,6-dehydratase